jgi:molybdopterin-binding protein
MTHGDAADAGRDDDRSIRIGQAAELLGVSVETIRRWESDGRLTTTRSAGGQRQVQIADVSRLMAQRRRATADPAIVAQSARNRFAGIVTSIRRDEIVAQVEVMAGPHRLVSLMTAEAVDELDLKVGDRAVCVIKATQVIVEIPSAAGGTRVSTAGS